MSAHLTLVVGGAPALAEALRGTGAFADVHPVASTGELRTLVGSGNLPAAKEQLVFLFADNLPADAQAPLDLLVGKLTMSGRKVIVLALTPNAQTLVSAHRQAGLLAGPFTLNATLGAISGLGLGLVAPSEDPSGYEPFDPVNGPVPATQPAPPASPQVAPSGGSWMDAGGWDAPAEQQTQPTPAPSPSPSPWEQVGSGGLPDAWKSPPAVDPVAPQDTRPPAAEPDPAPSPSPSGGRSLAAAAAGRSLADVAAQPATSPAQPATSGAPAGWEQTGGWSDAPDDSPVQMPAAAPVARGGMNVQHAQLRQRRGWVVTISSPKGGTGKTSLSTNLAAFLGLQLRAEGKTVCLIDGNYGQADVGKILDTYAPNVVDLARDPSGIHVDRIAQQLVHRPDLNMSALLGPASPKDANPVYITPKLYNQILDVLRELYDYILIDTQVAERFSSMHSEFSVPRADRLIVPVTPNVGTLMNADAWLRSICEPSHSGGIGYDESKVGILLNMAMDGVDCDVEDVMRELGSWTFVGDIPMTPVWQKALNNNDLVATYNYEELNRAFAAVLYAATGEPALMQQASHQAAASEEGFAGKLKGLLKRKGR